MKLLHDLLLNAARCQSDVTILCSSLRPAVRERYYKSVTKISFADSLEDVLLAGGNVRVLVWDDPREELIADSIKELVLARRGRWTGQLDIRFSGTREHADEVSHFTIAHGPTYWGLRVEEPHPRPNVDEPLTDDSPSLEAAGLFGEVAEGPASSLLKVFDQLFEAIG